MENENLKEQFIFWFQLHVDGMVLMSSASKVQEFHSLFINLGWSILNM